MPQRYGATRRRSAAAAAGNPVARWLDALPSLSLLDVIDYRAVAVGLPLLSIGIITGAMWAKEAWGAYWQWDPKETAALFSWILYLAYMHLHTRPAWRGSHELGQRHRLRVDCLLLSRREHLDFGAAQLQGMTCGTAK